MTIRDVYENCLIELNKVLAPSLLIKDFIYLYNKAVQNYFNKRYTLFEVNQQLTDDLRVLTKTVQLPVTLATGPVFGLSYDCILPDDYVHILNCICEFEQANPNKHCNDLTIVFQLGANKLDTNQWSSVINNYYMRPSEKLPYYYIININDYLKSGVPDSVKNQTVTDAATTDQLRYGNSVKPIMLIKCGNKVKLRCVYVDYLRAPLYLSLDENVLDKVLDDSQVLEFPDYVCYQIVNEIVTEILENSKDQRIQTFPVVNQSLPQK